MKSFLSVLVLSIATSSFSQQLKFKITGQKDTTVHLVRYYGSKLFYADTAQIKNGLVTFDGKKQKPGMLGILLPDQKMFEFIYNNEDVHLETTYPNFIETMKVKKSEENKIFTEYVQFMTTKKKSATEVNARKDKATKGSPEFEKASEEMKVLNKEVENYQNEIVKNHGNKLVGKIVKMSMEPVIPDAPKDANGKIIDSSFQFNYFRSHYFDNIDLKEDGLVGTAMFASKLEYYFSNKMMVPHWDTVLHHAHKFIEKLDPKSKMFEYCVSWITSTYGKSNQMGMDKVYTMMADRYYCTRNADGKSPAFWMTEEKLADLCEKTETQKRLVMGVVPHNLILRDTTDVNWVDMFNDIDAEYTILYFWEATCGHCKKITPKLQTLYEKKFKDRNIEVYAVGKAIGDDFETWKQYIREKNLTFINVALTDKLYTEAQKDARQFIPKYTTIESLNYQKHYDLFATPRVFVLNKNKELIAKQISISQLEDLMDRLQGKTDLPKLFPPDPEEDASMK